MQTQPFSDYQEYTAGFFHVIDCRIRLCLDRMMRQFAAPNGSYKNVLYPDLEIASESCDLRLQAFLSSSPGEQVERADENFDLSDLFGSLEEENLLQEEKVNPAVEEQMAQLRERAEQTIAAGISLPMYSLCETLKLSDFSRFCFVAGVLSSMQTVYASIFQVINQNGALSAPTVESAARIFYGDAFTMTTAYAEMSRCLEQLKPVLQLQIRPEMPFSTVISPDKRMIDFLFGADPMALDANFARFYAMLTNREALNPIMANEKKLDALGISYDSGVRLFSLWGDEGSGRKFFIQNFCRQRNVSCITLDCGKLFVYDLPFIEKALWAVCRECILTNSCCCLDGLTYHDEEKERFFGNLDLAYSKLLEAGIAVFNVSEAKLPLREVTGTEFTQLELETPSNYERFEIWKLFAADYSLDSDVDLEEMATKFLFTAGKIKAALHQGRSLSNMERLLSISRKCLFEACYNQMKHELTQKATKVKVVYTLDDIVMNPRQRETIEHVCEQMKYRKQVYEQWDYNRKYPYGRGLSVLLFGAPGTGKSMCAQVIASALNLELYRVDLSKVIDKYVGETEKSISMIFREAKKCNVVLFFDEADTMFGKRTDTGGAGESAANNKTAHLLQEVEAYDGVTVLATNYKHNIDPAFFRRMKFIVEFEFPDPDTRYMLWKTTIPKGTPLAEDVDLRFLAERFEFAGGNIKNCILNAAFFAAADGDGKEVHMKHYLMAIRYEFIKTGKIFAKTDFEPYANLLGLD